MKPNDFDERLFETARPQPVHRVERGLRSAIPALKEKLLEAWVSLYAAPPRRLGPLI